MTHIHKYQRIYIGGRKVSKDKDGNKIIINVAKYEVFKCTIPGCPTYKTRELAVGDKSICWKCGLELILNAENMKLKRPTHPYCRKIRESAA